MNGDIFTKSSKQNMLDKENNFFIQPEKISASMNVSENTKHLNDYDFNILKEDAYKDITDQIFKIEYKINRAEKELEQINQQINAAETIQNYKQIEILNQRKIQLELELENLSEIYNEASISAKISDGIMGKIKSYITLIKRKFISFLTPYYKKFPKSLISFFELKNSLISLENINKSVDELISLKIPYGEAHDKYEQLSQYIVKANSIQSDISKVWRK